MHRIDVIHERLHIPKDARLPSFRRTKHAPITRVPVLPRRNRRAALPLHVALREEDELVLDPHIRRVRIRIDDRLLLLLARDRDREGLALEETVLALPHGDGVVEALRARLHAEALLEVFADGPRAFAEAPVAVGLAGAAVHHAGRGGGRGGADGAGARQGGCVGHDRGPVRGAVTLQARAGGLEGAEAGRGRAEGVAGCRGCWALRRPGVHWGGRWPVAGWAGGTHV